MAVAVDLKKGNVKKKGVVGFSWTTLFFGFFVPLFRGDITWALIMLGAALFTAGISNIVFACIYNKFYTEKLLQDGFEPVGDSDKTALKFKGLYSE
ncbi:MAG: hypothetical protein IJM82_01660 [Synergistaceae bacterium]|nr:hypothetical protein [Synergistaceae bacterium]MBQ7067852.1 hypothetical protein [Synergistaceae bacterium]MBR0317242.1 hypothetical protein [Synergistaceae bacterium]